ncbi:hypothetical protein F8M41_012462 [Gigaspora margarita]|uniref:Uncharacterized protein n=1 Tax=Gigaspora margarita TaxID=4874 RepID=A0A8H3X0W8_GIGMA|nr:hypothetical protein F8M41_012462 [Gigaspora margarita]
MPEDSKELLRHLTDGFLFLSTSAPNSFIRPFEITEQFALLSIMAEGTCTIFSKGKLILQHIVATSLEIILRIKSISIELGHEIFASDCDPSGQFGVVYLFAGNQFELDLILVARYEKIL